MWHCPLVPGADRTPWDTVKLTGQAQFVQRLLSGALGVDSKQIKNKVIASLHPIKRTEHTPVMENWIGNRIL